MGSNSKRGKEEKCAFPFSGEYVCQPPAREKKVYRTTQCKIFVLRKTEEEEKPVAALLQKLKGERSE